jgi:hypothetical protein
MPLVGLLLMAVSFRMMAILPLVAVGGEAHHGHMIPMQMKQQLAEQQTAGLRRLGRRRAARSVPLKARAPHPHRGLSRRAPRRVPVRWGY